VNIEWLLKNYYILDWSKNFTTQTRGETIDSPTSHIKFGHWMQKLQCFELDFQTMQGHSWSPWAVRG